MTQIQPGVPFLRSFGSMIRAADEEATDTKALRFIASDDGMDRYGTRIAQDWTENGRDANFRANPIALWMHDADKPPIGTVMEWEVKELDLGRRGLVVSIAFDEEDPESARIAGKYRRGVLNAVSVRFLPSRAVALSTLDQSHPWRADEGYMLAENELMEISAVTIPGNPRALLARERAWLSAAILDAAPGPVRAEVERLLREDVSIRKLVRELDGDLHSEGIAAAVPAALTASPALAERFALGRR